VMVGMLGALVAAPALGEPAAPPMKLIVFANRSTPVNKLSNGQLRDVLLGETATWSNGKPVIILFPDDRSMTRALKRILNMSKDNYEAYFSVKKYQQSDRLMPRLFPNTDAVLQVLATVPGTITVLEGEPDMVVAGAKAVRIDGKLPDEDGYRY
jgi:hypothetical protein